MNGKLIVLVGMPGSGKTTFAKNVLEDEDVVIISSDEIRLRLTGDESDQSQNDEVFRIYYREIRNYLLDGRNVVADSTNLRRQDRERLRQIAKDAASETHLIIFNNGIQATIRNSQRERKVPDHTVLRMAERLQSTLEGMTDEMVINEYNSVTYISSVE